MATSFQIALISLNPPNCLTVIYTVIYRKGENLSGFARVTQLIKVKVKATKRVFFELLLATAQCEAPSQNNLFYNRERACLQSKFLNFSLWE